MSNGDAASEILREAGLTPKTAPAWRTQRQASSTPRKPYAGGRPGTPLGSAERAQVRRMASEIDAALMATPEGREILARHQ